MKTHDRAILGAHLLGQAAILFPLVLHPLVPLPDFPKIVAKMHVVQATATDPVLASNYEVHWGYAPYLGTELVMVPLLQWLDPIAAGRLYVGLALALTAIAPAVAHRVLFGKLGPWPLLAYPIAWNHLHYWNFMNFQLALPLVLFAIVAWVRSERMAVPLRVGLFGAISFGLMTLHLFAWGALGLGVLGAQLARRELRALVVGGAPFALSFALWRLMPKPQEGHSVFVQAGGEPMFRYGTAMERVRDLTAPLNFAWLASDVLVICVGACVLYWLARERPARVHPDLRAPMAAVLVGVFAMPHIVMYAWGTMRLPALFALLLLAGLQPVAEAGRSLRVVLALGAALLVVRMAQIEQQWSDCQAPMTEVRDALRKVEPGAAVVSVLADGNQPECLQRPVFSHVAAYAVIDRSAYSPQLAAFSTVFPTQRREALAAIGGPLVPEQLTPEQVATLQREADYLLYMHHGQQMRGMDAGFSVVAESAWFTLLRAAPDSG